MALAHLTDVEARTVTRLLQQHRDATGPGLLEVLEAFGIEHQVLEDVQWTTLDDTAVASAVGVQLDRLGELVGEQRKGLDDEMYRVRIAARILVNRSSGSIAQLVAIFSVLEPDATVQLVEEFPAAFDLKVNGVAISEAFAAAYLDILNEAKKAGVGTRLEFSTATTGSGFCFAGGTGKGFPDASLTPGSGGMFAGVKG